VHDYISHTWLAKDMMQMGYNCFIPRIPMTKLGLLLSHTKLAVVMIVWLVTE